MKLQYKMLKNLTNKWASMPAEGESVRFKASGYMDLVIENLGSGLYSMSHYGEQNGDLMADPDVTFTVSHERCIMLCRSFRNDYTGYEQIAGEGKYLPDVNQFMLMWLKNLKAQGHKVESSAAA